MKRTLLAVEFLLFVTTSFAQGLVTFANGPTTQISSGMWGFGVSALPANSPGSYYFALLTSPTANGPFSLAGIYGTNSASAGRIAPYTTSVPGWAPGATMFYEVAGWSANLGTAFNPNFLISNYGNGKSGFFGVSSVASGVAGGGLPVPVPAWNLFGGTGLAGFNLNPVGGALVPEPSSFALACLGAVLFLFRRRQIDWLTAASKSWLLGGSFPGAKGPNQAGAGQLRGQVLVACRMPLSRSA